MGWILFNLEEAAFIELEARHGTKTEPRGSYGRDLRGKSIEATDKELTALFGEEMIERVPKVK